jgi:hypothetical protein
MGYSVSIYILILLFITFSCGTSTKKMIKKNRKYILSQSDTSGNLIPIPPPVPADSSHWAGNTRFIGRILSIQPAKKDYSVIYSIKILNMLNLGSSAPAIAAGDTVQVLSMGKPPKMGKGARGICTLYARLFLAYKYKAKAPKWELLRWKNK